LNHLRSPVVQALVLLAVLTAAPGCVDVNGGAVELSWSVRTLEGTQSGCDPEDANLATVSVWLRSCDQLIAGLCHTAEGMREVPTSPLRTFECARGQAVTSFEVPEGRKEMWITVGCPTGDVDDAVVRVPEPLVRDVVEGQVTQLHALLIAWDPSRGRPCP
jgi:hypothetical protein